MTLKEVLAKLVFIRDDNLDSSGDSTALDLNAMMAPIKAIFESDTQYQIYLAAPDILDTLEAKYRAKNPLASDATQAQKDEYEAQVAKHMEEVEANLKAALRDDPDVRASILANNTTMTGVTNEANFKSTLVGLLKGFVPVLNFLLADRNILLIKSTNALYKEDLPDNPGTYKGLLAQLLGMMFYIEISEDADGKMLVKMLQDWNDVTNPSKTFTLKLADLLPKLVMIGEDKLDVADMFDNIIAYNPSNLKYQVMAGNEQQSFLNAVYYMLGPVMPLLNVFLAGTDIKLISMDVIQGYEGVGGADSNNPDDPMSKKWEGQGFLVIDGYNGYKTGLLPLLMAIGAGVPDYVDGDGGSYNGLVFYDDFVNAGGTVNMAALRAALAAAATPGDIATAKAALKAGKEALGAYQLKAIVEPLLWLVNTLAENPVKTLLQVLPNLLYFIIPGVGGESLISQALENILYPVTALLGNLVPVLGKLSPDLLGSILKPIDLGFGGLTLNLSSVDDLKDLSKLIDSLLVQVMGKSLVELLTDAAKAKVADAEKALDDADSNDPAAIEAAELALQQAQAELEKAKADLSGLGTLGTTPIGPLLKQLIVGEETIFGTPWRTVGIDSTLTPPDDEDKASYVEMAGKEGRLIIQLLNMLIESGLLVDEDGNPLLTGNITDIISIIVGLLNIDGKPWGDGPELIDYGQAPEPTSVDYETSGAVDESTLPDTLKDRAWLFKYAGFLVDNIDAVLDWAWKELVYNGDHYEVDDLTHTLDPQNTYPLQQPVLDALNQLLGMGLSSAPSPGWIIAAGSGKTVSAFCTPRSKWLNSLSFLCCSVDTKQVLRGP